MTNELVVLVDEHGNCIGTEEKMAAHQKGLLHAAFSVFVFNSNHEMLLQRRAQHKYHSGGLWTNTCCSHPRPNETTDSAAHRRLVEEMGFDCPLQYKFEFIYHAKLDLGMTEHELDQVLFGYSDTLPKPNPAEVCEYRYIDLTSLEAELKQYPERYTAWFKLSYQQVRQHWLKLIKQVA
ncbi:isopentenyl-diphosphate Delta-isomerase [Ferrimonas lipolytica]|uniref:Isopentenyl-diphosphate Delta-isomerase n=1 Tax=Ferrimonas lipolytica TaxID=2724191 RepID=A0A6H1UCA5_9GAMM|nr:isopentenyl-diphosphate Delta-isomerase [Ferrimonas lipolytica]QIZ76705.1 isopentenyl-diphosphate Delta-isomerase [Ferrimonas lipolytica]